MESRRYRNSTVEKDKLKRGTAAEERRTQKQKQPKGALLSCDICGATDVRITVIHVEKPLKLCPVHMDGAVGVLNQYVEDEKNARVQPRTE